MESEHKRQDELKHEAEAAQEAERKAKYELALAREEEHKMVRHGAGWLRCLMHAGLCGICNISYVTYIIYIM